MDEQNAGIEKDVKTEETATAAPPKRGRKSTEPRTEASVKSEEKASAGRGGTRRFTDGGQRSRVTLPGNKEPTFFIGGNNGVNLVRTTCEELGWRQITEKQDENFRLKWVELKNTINYATFKEGEQLVNHIPNCNLLTNKLGLLNSLQEYDKAQTTLKKGKNTKPKLDFIPETYRLDNARDRQIFFDTYKPGEIWICKPTGRNQGKGIFLVRSLEEVKKLTDSSESDRSRPSKPLNRIIQRYIKNPLLLDGKKFDIRVYMLVASTSPFLVLFHNGYVRVSIHDYDNECDNLIAHLTNQYIQKKDPTYKEVKEDTTWSMERFNDYVNEHVVPNKEGIEENWVHRVLPVLMKKICTYTFNSVRNKLNCKVGYFDLYGIDFMIDEDMKVYLIEVNVNPCLAINCEALRSVVPEVVKETIHVAVECFDKARKGRPLMPLDSLSTFDVLVEESCKNGSSGAGGTAGAGGTRVKRTQSQSPLRAGAARETQRAQAAASTTSLSPVRRSRSLSPVKEAKEVHTSPQKANQTNDTIPPIAEKEKKIKPNARRTIPKATIISPGKKLLAETTQKKTVPAETSSPKTVAHSHSEKPKSPKVDADSIGGVVGGHIPSPFPNKADGKDVKLKMTHDKVKRTRSKTKGRVEDEEEVPNRGS